MWRNHTQVFFHKTLTWHDLNEQSIFTLLLAVHKSQMEPATSWIDQSFQKSSKPKQAWRRTSCVVVEHNTINMGWMSYHFQNTTIRVRLALTPLATLVHSEITLSGQKVSKPWLQVKEPIVTTTWHHLFVLLTQLSHAAVGWHPIRQPAFATSQFGYAGHPGTNSMLKLIPQAFNRVELWTTGMLFCPLRNTEVSDKLHSVK